MKSGTLYFNWPLFRKTVLRFWPIWAIYAPVQGFIIMLMVINM